MLLVNKEDSMPKICGEAWSPMSVPSTKRLDADLKTVNLIYREVSLRLQPDQVDVLLFVPKSTRNITLKKAFCKGSVAKILRKYGHHPQRSTLFSTILGKNGSNKYHPRERIEHC